MVHVLLNYCTLRKWNNESMNAFADVCRRIILCFKAELGFGAGSVNASVRDEALIICILCYVAWNVFFGVFLFVCPVYCLSHVGGRCTFPFIFCLFSGHSLGWKFYWDDGMT